MTEKPKDLATEAIIAAVHGEKEDVLHLQHALIQEEVKERKAIERANLAGIKEDEQEVTAELLKTLPENDVGAADAAEQRKERHLLAREKLQLHREERAEERAYWTDVQPLTREDRDIHKALLIQDQRTKRIDELL
ncbi:MAG TPA: hypothetical protein VGO08_03910 [Burkholderiales bacterium]|jgi:hypothetical protein|nr:hypothetical protein [Burkholderiales bacterium]